MSSKRIIRIKTRLKGTYQQFIRGTSIKSLLFEKGTLFFGKKIEKKGLELKITLVSHGPQERFFLSSASNERSNFGFVFQGGFENERQLNYFRYTIEALRGFNADVPIVLSTFPSNNKFASHLSELSKANKFEIIINQDPGKLKKPYAKNLLRQMTSTYHGLTFLNDFGVEKAIKIRIDQRIANLSSLVLVERLFETFPSAMSGSGAKIIGSSLNSFKSLPLFMSDCLLFGYVNDLKDYWRVETQETILESIKKIQSQVHQLDPNLLIHPEIWLALRYVFSKGVAPNTLQGINNLFWMDLALVVDSVFLNHQWEKQPKYFASNYKSIKWLEPSLTSDFQEMTFLDWLSIYGRSA